MLLREYYRAVKAYFAEVGVALTCLLNALTGGSHKHTFSARCGAAAAQGVWWGVVLAPVIDRLLFSRKHCWEQAIEEGLLTF